MLLYYSAVTACAGVAEWQTRQTQNLLVATLYGFKSHRRHLRGGIERCLLFLLVIFCLLYPCFSVYLLRWADYALLRGMDMTCKETEKMIPFFLQDDLETEELREFMEHIEECDDCREELTIQFLVTEGMSRLEEGNVFDLQNELRYRMDEAEHVLKRRENMQWLLYCLEGLVVLAIIILIMLLILL